jgi:hypothetical protein
MEPFPLSTGPLLLRPWRDDDVPVVVPAMLRRRQFWSAGDHASCAVLPAAGGELLGSVSLHSIDPEQADAEIGH